MTDAPLATPSLLPLVLLATSFLPAMVIFALPETATRVRTTLNLAGAGAKVGLVIALIPLTVDGETHQLPHPFLVAATQNPVEYEGTYTLPEAQLDRFLLKLVLDLPARDAEVEVMQRHADGFNPRDLAAAGVTGVVDADAITAARAAVAEVRASPELLGYIVDLARATRQSPSVKLGVSPRGTTALLAAAKAWAWLQEAEAITPDHVQAMLLPVWRHRIALRPEAELEGVSADTILRSIVQQVQVPL